MKKYMILIIVIIFIAIIVSPVYAAASAFLRSGGLRVIGDIYCHTNSGCIAQATKECLPILDNASEAGNPEWFDCFEKAELVPPLVTSPSPNASTTPAAGTTNTNPSPTPTPTPTPSPTPTATPRATPLDTDGDGILNGSDRCPTQAEDLDGDRDTDGCPESPLATTTPRPTSTPTLRPTPTPRASTTPRPSISPTPKASGIGTKPPGPPKPAPTSTPTPRPTTQTCTPQVTSVTIGNNQPLPPGSSVGINLQQYGCSATPGSTCSVTALVNLTCGTPNPYPITLSFTYTGPAGSGGSGGTPQTCQEKGGSNYCAGKYGNQYYDCGQPNQVIGQTTADGEGCYNENLVNPPPVQPQTCQTKGGSNYCAGKYGNQYYDCQPGYPGADSEGCYNENLVNPPPVQPQTCQTKGGSNYCASKYGNQYYDCQPGYPGADSEGCFHEYEPPPTCTSNDDYDQFVQCIGCGQAFWVCPEDPSKPPILDADYPWETRCRTTQWCGGGGGGGSGCSYSCQLFDDGYWAGPVSPTFGGSCPACYPERYPDGCWHRC